MFQLLSASLVAGMIALINDMRVEANLSTVGWITPMVYRNAGSFVNDIIDGTIDFLE